MKNFKKFGLSLLVFGLVLVGGFSSSVQKANAAATITASSALITGPNQITIIFNSTLNLTAAPVTAYGVTNNGVSALTLASGGGVRNIVSLDGFVASTGKTAVYTFSGAAATIGDTGSLDAAWNPTAITDGTDTFNAASSPILLTDGQAPTAPTAVAVTPVGGTVVANTLNGTNTNMTATANITAGQATGGYALLKVGATTISTDNTILIGDTTVDFDLGLAGTAALQAAVTAGGVVTVTLFNSGGANTVSAVGNPTLIVDYIAPTFTSGVLQNTTATNVDMVITGTEFDAFYTSGADTAGKISYNGFFANSVVKDSATQMTATYSISSVGTVPTTGITFSPNAVKDTAGNPNNSTYVGTGSITDNASPVLRSVVLSNTGTRNIITFTYSEPMFIGNGASNIPKGDTTVAGTVAGFGSFATAGNVVVPTTKNTISGNGTVAIVLSFADQAGGYMTTGSSTEPSGVFTPVSSSQLVDVNSLQVAVAATPTSSGTGTWDLTKPTLTSITVYDAAGSNNGRIDRAALLFSKDVRANSFTDANGQLGTEGTLTGAFTVGTTTATFNRTDDNAVDTSTVSGDFLYSGATTFITDVFGNLLNTTVDGTIITADAVEVDAARPIVVSTVPANTSISQSNTAPIVITFSEPMTPTSFTSYVTSTASGVATGDVFTATWSNTKTVSLAHVTYRSAGHEYTMGLTTSITDASSALKTLVAYSWTFTPLGSSRSYFINTTDITAPTGTSVSIEKGATAVSESNVTLTLTATDAKQMVIANTPDFYGVSWETYATTKAWTLISGNGTRTVYAKFRDTLGNVSNMVEDSIVVNSSLAPRFVVTIITTPVTPATPATHIEGCEPGSGNLFSTTSGKSCTVAATPAIPGNVTTTVTNTNGTDIDLFTKSIKYGAKENDVIKLQKFLNNLGHNAGIVDGAFGPKTKAGVKAFQKATNGLKVDGIFGPKTMKKANELLLL